MGRRDSAVLSAGLGTSWRAGLTGDEFGDGDAVLRQGLLQPFLLHVAGVAPGVAQSLNWRVRSQIAWQILTDIGEGVALAEITDFGAIGASRLFRECRGVACDRVVAVWCLRRQGACGAVVLVTA